MPWHESRAPVSPIDTTTSEFAANAIGFYDIVRAQGPVVWLPQSRGFLLTRYSDCFSALRDQRLKSPDLSFVWRELQRKLGRDYSAAIELFSFMPFILEGERHRHLRRAFALAVAPFAGGTPEIDRSIQSSLRAARRNGGFDLASDFAVHLLFDVMCALMKVPVEERQELRPVATVSWALETMLPMRMRDEAAASIARAREYLGGHVQRIIASTDDANFLRGIYEALPPDMDDRVGAVATIAAVMLVMGNDALGACIAVAVQRLKSDDGPTVVAQSDWARIADDAIRYVAPVDFINRIPSEDVEIAGVRFRKGERLIISPLCANHDPAEFGIDPNTIMERAGRNIGLTFGGGSHQCVGNRFSRTIVNRAFAGLAALPAFALQGEVIHGPGKIVRSIASLPVTFH